MSSTKYGAREFGSCCRWSWIGWLRGFNGLLRGDFAVLKHGIDHQVASALQGVGLRMIGWVNRCRNRTFGQSGEERGFIER